MNISFCKPFILTACLFPHCCGKNFWAKGCNRHLRVCKTFKSFYKLFGMKLWQFCLLPLVTAIKQFGKNFQLALRNMNDTVRMAGNIPVAIGILDAWNRRGGFALVTLCDAFSIVEVTDGVERHHQWTTIHI